MPVVIAFSPLARSRHKRALRPRWCPCHGFWIQADFRAEVQFRDRRQSKVAATVRLKGETGGAIVRHMYEHHHTVIAGARNRLSGRVIRIGTMGAVGEGDILTDLLHLEETLRALGRPAAKGAGVAAAAAILADGIA